MRKLDSRAQPYALMIREFSRWHKALYIKKRLRLPRPRSALMLFDALSLFILSACAHASAGSCYTAIPVKDETGKEQPIEPVCRILEQNLNRFCDQPPQVCGLRVAPEFSKQLEIPKWTPVNLNGSLDLVESIIRGPWQSALDRGQSRDSWIEDMESVKAAAKERRLTVSTAQFDFYQLGREVKAFRIDLGNCESNNSKQLKSADPGWWNTKLTQADIEILPSPEEIKKLEKQYFPLGSEVIPGDAFLFDGKPYWYSMYGYSEKDADMTTVNRIIVNQGINKVFPGNKVATLLYKNVCEVRYKVTERAP